MVSLGPFPVEVVDDAVVAKDGVKLAVSGRLEAEVVDPVPAATRVADYRDATQKMFRTAIRAVVKERRSAQVSNDTAESEAEVTRILTESLSDWGVTVRSVTLDLRTARE